MGWKPAGCSQANLCCWQLLRHLCLWRPAACGTQVCSRAAASCLHAWACMLGQPRACAASRCSKLCRWLGTQAEELGVDIYPGFAASELLLKGGAVAGVATNDFGVAKDGTRKPTFQRGMELQARATLLAEGCRGSLSEVGPNACMMMHLAQQGAGTPSGSSAGIGLCKLVDLNASRYRHFLRGGAMFAH